MSNCKCCVLGVFVFLISLFGFCEAASKNPFAEYGQVEMIEDTDLVHGRLFDGFSCEIGSLLYVFVFPYDGSEAIRFYGKVVAKNSVKFFINDKWAVFSIVPDVHCSFQPELKYEGALRFDGYKKQ
jgi:hypothetical protein